MSASRLATGAGFTFWLIGQEVYRAPESAGMDTLGAPMGKRWECSLPHWRRYRAVFDWAKDVKP